jgi:hypothetical protein
MASVRIGANGAATVGRLLREIGEGGGLSPDVRRNASRYAAAVRRRMERRDVEMIAWLLRDVSSTGEYPLSRRERARYWAAFLEGRI